MISAEDLAGCSATLDDSRTRLHIDEIKECWERAAVGNCWKRLDVEACAELPHRSHFDATEA